MCFSDAPALNGKGNKFYGVVSQPQFILAIVKKKGGRGTYAYTRARIHVYKYAGGVMITNAVGTE